MLNTDDWKSLKRIATHQKKFKRQVEQHKAQQKKCAFKFKFGVQIPANWKDARKIQDKLEHTLWTDAETIEREALEDYKTFQDLGKEAKPPPGHKWFRLYFVHDVKQDL